METQKIIVNIDEKKNPKWWLMTITTRYKIAIVIVKTSKQQKQQQKTNKNTAQPV